MKKRLLVLASMLVMSMSFVTACGGGSKSSNEASTEVSASTVASNLEVAVMDAAAAGAPVPGNISDVELNEALANYPEVKKLLSENLGVSVDSLTGYYITISNGVDFTCEQK